MYPRERQTRSIWPLIPTILLLIGLVACSQEDAQDTVTPSPTGVLTPFWTATPVTPTPSPTPDRIPASPTLLPSPTPTPFTYNVVEDDTLLAIASRYGISLDELLAANPGIDPNFLTIGMTLTIPILGDSSSILPTPTPVPLSLSPPRCYPTADKGLWCISLARNDGGSDLENISARITLNTTVDEAPLTQIAILPLNKLSSGGELPLIAFFSPPAPQEAQPQIQLLTALPVTQQEERYKQVEISISEVVISEQEDAATVRGEISIPDEGEPPSTVWLAGVAYTSDGDVAGYRKWEADASSIQGGRITYEITIFSLGPPIQRVEVYGEAR